MTRTQLRRIPAYLFLSFAVVLSVFPLYFMAVSATNTSNEVVASKLLPGSHLLENFQTFRKLRTFETFTQAASGSLLRRAL